MGLHVIVHLGCDFPRAVNLLLLRQSGDRGPAEVVWVNIAWPTKMANWGQAAGNWQANFSSKMITYSQARQSCDESGTDKLHFLLEAWVWWQKALVIYLRESKHIIRWVLTKSKEIGDWRNGEDRGLCVHSTPHACLFGDNMLSIAAVIREKRLPRKR